MPLSLNFSRRSHIQSQIKSLISFPPQHTSEKKPSNIISSPDGEESEHLISKTHAVSWPQENPHFGPSSGNHISSSCTFPPPLKMGLFPSPSHHGQAWSRGRRGVSITDSKKESQGGGRGRKRSPTDASTQLLHTAHGPLLGCRHDKVLFSSSPPLRLEPG